MRSNGEATPPGAADLYCFTFPCLIGTCPGPFGTKPFFHSFRGKKQDGGWADEAR